MKRFNIHFLISTDDLVSVGSHSIVVRSLLVDDFDTSDDLAIRNVVTLGTVNTFPYQESFEGTNGEWIAFTENDNNFNSWERGEPNGTTINAASDGTEAWVTNLNGDYDALEESFLISPLFDFTALEPVFSADLWYDTESCTRWSSFAVFTRYWRNLD